MSVAQALNDRMAAILESITEGLFIFDADWRCTYMNRRAEQTLRHPRAAFVGKYLWEIVADFGEHFRYGGKIFEQNVRAAMLEKREASFETSFDDHWLVTHVYPVSEGVAVYFQDITQRKLTEFALRESEAKYRRLVEANLVGIVVSDLHGHVLEANDIFLTILGYTRQELERGELNWRAITPSEYRQAEDEAIRQLHERGIYQPFEKEY